MPKPNDVGNIVLVEDEDGFQTNTTLVQMWIKGPKGTMYIYDNFWFHQRPNDNVDNKCRAIKEFMEFNNG